MLSTTATDQVAGAERKSEYVTYAIDTVVWVGRAGAQPENAAK
jgi:hypothetical protein